jgi:hypothetical protein
VGEPAVSFVSLCVVELLGEWWSGSEFEALPVDDVDSDDEEEGDADEDRVAVLQVAWRFVVGTNIYCKVNSARERMVARPGGRGGGGVTTHLRRMEWRGLSGRQPGNLETIHCRQWLRRSKGHKHRSCNR